MHPNGSTGPQIGHCAVMSDRVVYRSSYTRPALALHDIAVQISRANADRYALGKALHEAPKHIGQLVPLYMNSNPTLEAMLADQPLPAAVVTGSLGAPIKSQRKSDLRGFNPAVDNASGIGWTERAA